MVEPLDHAEQHPDVQIEKRARRPIGAIETLPADKPLIDQMAEELQAKEVIEMHLRAIAAFQIAALLQLALRHPAPSDDLRRTGEMLLGHVRAFFADCPATLEIIRRGDDPREDRPK